MTSNNQFAKEIPFKSFHNIKILKEIVYQGGWKKLFHMNILDPLSLHQRNCILIEKQADRSIMIYNLTICSNNNSTLSNKKVTKIKSFFFPFFFSTNKKKDLSWQCLHYESVRKIQKNPIVTLQVTTIKTFLFFFF